MPRPRDLRRPSGIRVPNWIKLKPEETVQPGVSQAARAGPRVGQWNINEDAASLDITKTQAEFRNLFNNWHSIASTML